MYVGALLCLLVGGAVFLLPNNYGEVIGTKADVIDTDIPETIIPSPTSERNSESWMENGSLLEAQGEFKDAIASYNSSFEKDPSNLQALAQQVELHLRLYEPEHAFEKSLRLTALDSETPYYQFLLEESALATKTTKAEISDYIQNNLFYLLEKEGRTAEEDYLLCLGFSYVLNESRADLCLSASERLEDISRKAMSRILFEQTKAFETFKDASPEYLQTLFAKSFLQANQLHMATTLLEEVTTSLPEYRDAWTLLGFSLLEQGSPNEAISALKQAYSLDTTDANIQFLLGQGYLDAGDTSNAITFFSLALDNQYEDREFLVPLLTNLLEQEGKIEESLSMMNRLIDDQIFTSPEDYKHPVYLANTVLHDSKQGVEIARKAVTAFPESTVSNMLLGWSYLENNQLDDAKRYLDASLKVDWNNAESHYYVGLWHERKGDLDRAKESLNRAIEFSTSTSTTTLATERLEILESR